MRDRRPTIGRHRVAQRLRGSIRCWRWRSRQRQTCPSARIYCFSCQWRLSVWTESKHLLVRLDHCAREKEIGVSREKEQEKKVATTRYQACMYQRGRQANAPLAIVRRLELFLSSSRTFGEPHKCSHASSATAAPSSRSPPARPAANITPGQWAPPTSACVQFTALPAHSPGRPPPARPHGQLHAMLLLDYQNVLIEALLKERFSGCARPKDPTSGVAS